MGSLAGVVRIYFCCHVFVANVGFVNEFELLDGFLFLRHRFKHAAELVDQIFFLAAKTLQNAIKEKLLFDDEKKDLIYQLGCVFEAMTKKEEAIEQFKLIYETDIGYKDVSAKVDKYYSGQ